MKFAEKFAPDSVVDDKYPLDLERISQKRSIMESGHLESLPLLYKSSGAVARADGVRSGMLATQLSNHETNVAQSDIFVHNYNAQSSDKVKHFYQSIVGDDIQDGYKMIDGQNFTRAIGKKMIDALIEHAENIKLVISGKRTIASSVTTENIKMYVAHGYMIQDIMLDWKTSEKNTFIKQTFLDKVTSAYDIAMTMGVRMCNLDKLMNELLFDYCFFNGVRAGDITIIPSSMIWACNGGPEILLTAPEIRNYGMILRQFMPEKFTYLSRLNLTIRSNVGKEKYSRQMLRQNPGMASEYWGKYFARSNGYDITDTDWLESRLVEKLAPENAMNVLNERLFLDSKEIVIKFMNDDDSITKIINNKLKSFVPRKYFAHFNVIDGIAKGEISPYIGSDVGVQNVHRIVGLARRNVTLLSEIQAIDRVLNKFPNSGPAYIKGADLLAAAFDVGYENYHTMLALLGFKGGSIPNLATILRKTMPRYIDGKNQSNDLLFDNLSRTYDVSSENLKVRIPDTSSMMNSSANEGYRIEGMKSVIYMARRGYTVNATRNLIDTDKVTFVKA